MMRLRTGTGTRTTQSRTTVVNRARNTNDNGTGDENGNGMTPVPDSQLRSPASQTAQTNPAQTNLTIDLKTNPNTHTDPHLYLVSSVYESVWDDYASFHDSYCRRSLAALSRRRGGYTRPAPLPLPVPLDASASDPPVPRSDDDDEGDLFEITDYPPSPSSSPVTYTCTSHTTSIPSPLPINPYPTYDSTPALSRNLLRGDDPDYLPFLPFADDAGYDFTWDVALHKWFGWERDEVDNNSEMILLEVVQRLTTTHGLTPLDIDRTRVLPMRARDILRLEWTRDLLRWTSSSSSSLPNASVSSSAGTKPTTTSTSTSTTTIGNTGKNKQLTPRQTIRYMLDHFCANLNCVTPYCSTHLKTRTPAPVAPKIHPSKLIDGVQQVCGRECFALPMWHGGAISEPWTEHDIQMLHAILDYEPDGLPCDLAVICRRPCREVYRQRLTYTSPAPPPERPKHSIPHLGKNMRDLNMFDDKERRMATRLLCKHPGPCDAKSNCACFLTNAPCYTRCGCMKSCHRRWKGCTCAKAAKVCGTKKCSCFKADMECDPELCIACEARDHTSNLCRNVSIQRGSFKVTEVKESKWGLGLFVKEPCEKGDFIAEYVGELIYNPTVRSRTGVATHKNRSYIFDLNRRVAIDAMAAGNYTRYINHDDQGNCNTAVFLVNGEQRIGIYAACRIEEDEELFINYGPNFFSAQPAP